jgi:hypothetical protein
MANRLRCIIHNWNECRTLASRSLVSCYSGLAKIMSARLIKMIVIGVEANGCNWAGCGKAAFGSTNGQSGQSGYGPIAAFHTIAVAAPKRTFVSPIGNVCNWTICRQSTCGNNTLKAAEPTLTYTQNQSNDGNRHGPKQICFGRTSGLAVLTSSDNSF